MDNVSKAVQYYENGYMCSQAVFAAFAEEFGITEKQAFQIGACFGGGMCKGEVCGACTGALMVLGMKYGQFDLNDTASRAKGRAMAVKFLDEFEKRKGSYICRDLLGCDQSEVLMCSAKTGEGVQELADALVAKVKEWNAT